MLIIFSFFVLLLIILLFLRIPQSSRSFSENIFPIFSDIGVINSINRFRGQGIQEGLPSMIGALLFNKLMFLVAGLINFLKNLNPTLLFGYFDLTGAYNFSFSGLFPKILFIPFILGTVYLLKNFSKYSILVLSLFIIIFPAIFFYDKIIFPLHIIIIPLLAIIIALGIGNIKKYLKIILLFFVFLEILLIFVSSQAEKNNTNYIRPSWMGQLIQDISSKDKKSQIFLSDNLTADSIPLLDWYSDLQISTKYKDIDFPYKFHQTMIDNIELIGSEVEFRRCDTSEKRFLYLTERDSLKLKKWLNTEKIEVNERREILGVDGKIFYDNSNKPRIYYIEDNLCIS